MRAGVDRPAKDATVKISGAGVQEVDGQTGLAARTRALRRRIRAAITDPRAGRRFVVRTKTTQPAVTRADLAKQYGTIVVVNRGAFKLTLYKGLKAVKTYPIAVGQIGLETPAGLYAVQNKAVNPAWHVPNSAWAGDLAGKVISGSDPSNPIKARWLGIYDGVGIHGTSDDALDRQRRLARLHPHARRPTWRTSTTASPWGRRSTSPSRTRRPSPRTSRTTPGPRSAPPAPPPSPGRGGRHGGPGGEGPERR